MPPVLDGPRVNGAIRVPKVRCIDPEGNQLGVLDTREALTKAEDFGLDLVEVQPNADPPVCKILDYGKFKYEAQKRANEARKKQKTIEVKEIKFRPNIDEHDYQVKMRNVSKFLAAGDKVKVTLRFRGREMAHAHITVASGPEKSGHARPADRHDRLIGPRARGVATFRLTRLKCPR